MRLTLLRAKEALAPRCPAEKLDYRINRLCERLLNHKKFKGSIERIAIAAPYGQVSLPREYIGLEGVKVNGFTYDLGGQRWEFLPGQYDPKEFTMNAVRDLGDGWAILYTPRVNDNTPFDSTIPVNDIPAGGTITTNYAGVTTEIVTIEGRDIEGMPAILTFTGKQTLANPFARITRIHKEQGPVAVRVSYTTDDDIVTLLALMEPSEEETYYHRYVVDNRSCTEDTAIAALAKRRHIEFTSDRDILPFGNISALESGMDALQYEAENDLNLADTYWLKAVGILNDELASANGGVTFPKIRFQYPGGTTPRLTSHY
jgi:hypothetical protein